MCGRFVGAFSAEALMGELSAAVSGAHMNIAFENDNSLFSANYNTAPTQTVPVLRHVETDVLVDPMQWGLVPAWSKDPSVGSKMINARSETITEKPSFRQSVPRRRCIVPVTGFYEWDRSDPKRKVPYFVTREDGHLMLVAGIWTASPALDVICHTFTVEVPLSFMQKMHSIGCVIRCHHSSCLIQISSRDSWLGKYLHW